MPIGRHRNFYSINTTYYLRNSNINKKEIRRERERFKVLFIQKQCSQLCRERDKKKERSKEIKRERDKERDKDGSLECVTLE